MSIYTYVLYKDFRGEGTYHIKNEEVRAYTKVLSRLRDGEKIWDMTAKSEALILIAGKISPAIFLEFFKIKNVYVDTNFY